MRYLGRVSLGAVVVLVTAMRHGISAPRAWRLHALLGVSLRTLERWRTWWREAFVRGPFWESARGRFAPPVDVGRLPASLAERFAVDDEAARLVARVRLTRAGGRAHSPPADMTRRPIMAAPGVPLLDTQAPSRFSCFV